MGMKASGQRTTELEMGLPRAGHLLISCVANHSSSNPELPTITGAKEAMLLKEENS